MIWVTVIQNVLNAVLAYLAFHVTVHPVEKERDKVKIRVYKCLIVFCILGSATISVFQFIDSQNKDTKSKKDFNDLKSTITQNSENEKKEIGEKIDSMTAKQNSLIDQYHDLQEQVLTNENINPDTRQHILDANKQFDELDSDFSNTTNLIKTIQDKFRLDQASIKIQNDKARQITEMQAQESWEKCYSYYEYANRKLEDLIRGMAKNLNDTPHSNYHGMPDSIGFDIGTTNIAEMKLETNSNFDFTIFISPIKDDHGNGRYMTVKCNAGYLDILPFGDTVDFYLHVTDADYTYYSTPIKDAKKNIADKLEDLVYMEYQKCFPTNN
jgi:hypothetical protein